MRCIFRKSAAFMASMTKTVIFFTTIIMSLPIAATEVQKITPSKTAPLVIESQVKGSQEQPNVIYIMPWQGIANPISIEGNQQKIVLPHFKPINPKLFKQQATLFYQVNSSKKVQLSKSK
ncbi:hypothetical protein A9Q74_09100 [Colwellia sp. 39_35_sub15_T18]|nr:hypothetical protein A9Q74_09100 [Colwellia sp. 39_35_sub15_T18]